MSGGGAGVALRFPSMQTSKLGSGSVTSPGIGGGYAELSELGSGLPAIGLWLGSRSLFCTDGAYSGVALSSALRFATSYLLPQES